jgi:hypothetical protein
VPFRAMDAKPWKPRRHLGRVAVVVFPVRPGQGVGGCPARDARASRGAQIANRAACGRVRRPATSPGVRVSHGGGASDVTSKIVI